MDGVTGHDRAVGRGDGDQAECLDVVHVAAIESWVEPLVPRGGEAVVFGLDDREDLLEPQLAVDDSAANGQAVTNTARVSADGDTAAAGNNVATVTTTVAVPPTTTTSLAATTTTTTRPVDACAQVRLNQERFNDTMDAAEAQIRSQVLGPVTQRTMLAQLIAERARANAQFGRQLVAAGRERTTTTTQPSSPTCLGLPVTILGTDRNDTIVGTEGPDGDRRREGLRPDRRAWGATTSSAEATANTS